MSDSTVFPFQPTTTTTAQLAAVSYVAMDSSIVTMMHGVRGLFRFAHIDGLITADPAVYARLPKVQHDELIRFLQVAQTLTVHRGALAFLLGINALRASEAAAVRIEDYAERCGDTESCTWSARATSSPPCRSRSQCFVSLRPAEDSDPTGRSS